MLHLNLNELIAATQGASNCFINAQDFSEDETKALHNLHSLLTELTKQDNGLGETHSVEDAKDNHSEKLAAHVDQRL